MATPTLQPAYIGVDLGTSGVRGCLIDSDGKQLAESRAELPAPESPQPGYSQQPPHLWWSAVVEVLDVLSAIPCLDIRAISVDGTSGTLLLCDRMGQPLTPGLMYNDRRATKEAEELASVVPENSAAHGPSAALAKLSHLCRQTHHEARYAVHQADWIVGQLTGHWGVSDENNSLKLGYDPVARQWPDWMANCPVDTTLLPEVVPVGSAVGELKAGLCERWRLARRPQVVAGTTDSNAATLAAGVDRVGMASTALGSTLVLKVMSPNPIFSKEFGVYSHRIGRQWLVGGASNTGGGVLRQFFTPEQITTLCREIDPKQPSGLDYYPLPAKGERFPRQAPEMQARLHPRPPEEARFLHGLLEGIARIEVEGYRRLETLGAPFPERVLSTGGGAQNVTWQQIRQRLLGVPVDIAGHTEAAYGSALVAANRAFEPE